MIRTLLAALALFAVFVPAAAAHGGADAEIFATSNTAVITDSSDPRLKDRLEGFADRVERIIDDGGGRSRGSELLDGVFAGDDGITFERSRRFDVDRVSDDELHDIAETIRRRFLQQSVLTFDHDGPVNAIELDVPGVSARDLREGLLDDPDAAGRLFGGSVTLDRHLLLVASLEDAQLARSFAKKIGGDLRRAKTSYGEREFVEVATDGRARIEHGKLLITGTPEDDRLALREGRRLEIDFGDDGVVDFEVSRHRFHRMEIDLGDGDNDTLVRKGSPGDDRIELEARELTGVDRVEVQAGDGDDRVTVEDLSGVGVWQVETDLGAADGDLDRVTVHDSDEDSQTSVSTLTGRRERARERVERDRRHRADRPPARQRQRRRRHPQRLHRRHEAHARRRRRRQRHPRRARRRHPDRRRRLRRRQGRPRRRRRLHGPLLRPLQLGAGRRQRHRRRRREPGLDVLQPARPTPRRSSSPGTRATCDSRATWATS